MLSALRLIVPTLAFSFVTVTNIALASPTTEERLVAKYNSAMFQISTSLKGASGITSYGTGFLIKNNLLVTNYHVIDDYFLAQEDYDIIVTRGTDKSIYPVSLHTVDMFNDLAIFTVEANTDDITPFTLGESHVQQGATIYSMGNPNSSGFMIVPGVYNGVREASKRELLNFTGSLNSGMSGGPVIDSNEILVGVNVSSSGNGMGYAVNAKHLRTLVKHVNSNPPNTDSLSVALEQLHAWSTLITDMLKGKFSAQSNALEVNSPFVKCNNDKVEDGSVSINIKHCYTLEDLGLGGRHTLEGFSVFSYHVKDSDPNLIQRIMGLDPLFLLTQLSPLVQDDDDSLYSNSSCEFIVTTLTNDRRAKIRNCAIRSNTSPSYWTHRVTISYAIDSNNVIANDITFQGLSPMASSTLLADIIEEL